MADPLDDDSVVLKGGRIKATTREYGCKAET